VNTIFQGKTVIISGATRGIGRAIALELAGEGANISFNFLKSSADAESLVKKVKGLGADAKAFHVDIKDYEGVKSWVEETRESFGIL
jgi:3-oxoacyl-[acyl-carrier protein] reductase